MKPNIPVSRLVEFASGKLTPEEGIELLATIEEDPRASKMLEKTIELLDIAGESDRKNDISPVHDRGHGIRVVREKAAGVFRWAAQSRPRLALIGLGVIAGIAAVAISPLPGEAKLAARALPTDDEVHMVARGAERGEVELAAHLMAGERFEDAARVLDWYISAFPNSEDVARAHFLSGLAHLRLSKKGFMGIFAGIDRQEVRSAEAHLLSAWMLSRSSDLSLEAAWYLARAQILLQEDGRARDFLEFVIKEKGPHSADAVRLEQELSGR